MIRLLTFLAAGTTLALLIPYLTLPGALGGFERVVVAGVLLGMWGCVR